MMSFLFIYLLRCAKRRGRILASIFEDKRSSLLTISKPASCEGFISVRLALPCPSQDKMSTSSRTEQIHSSGSICGFNLIQNTDS